VSAFVALTDKVPTPSDAKDTLTLGVNGQTIGPSNATTKRTGKSMSRRRGQNGHIEKSGRWFVVRFWKDVVNQEKRMHVRERICPISGPGLLSKSARERRAKEIIATSGADTQEFLERIVLSKTCITFKEQSEVWFAHMSNPRREGKKTGLPTAASTLTTWRGILEKINAELGQLPLSALVEDQTPVADFVTKMVNDGRRPKTIRNYIQIVKMVVASGKDKKSRKQLYPVAWDQDVLLVPAVRERKLGD